MKNIFVSKTPPAKSAIQNVEAKYEMSKLALRRSFIDLWWRSFGTASRFNFPTLLS
jgi:hypothetical protein